MTKSLKIINIILCCAFIISFALNIFLAVNEEIKVTNIYKQQQYTNKAYSYLVMSIFASQGAITWDSYTEKDLKAKGFYKEDTKDPVAIAAFLKSLQPEQALMAKVVGIPYTYWIIVPTIVENLEKYNSKKVWKKIK